MFRLKLVFGGDLGLPARGLHGRRVLPLELVQAILEQILLVIHAFDLRVQRALFARTRGVDGMLVFESVHLRFDHLQVLIHAIDLRAQGAFHSSARFVVACSGQRRAADQQDQGEFNRESGDAG